MPGDGPSGRFYSFPSLVLKRVSQLAQEWAKSEAANLPKTGRSHFVMPIGLLMVIDEANGGDAIAKELLNRFHLLHAESGDIIEFYFMGWEWVKLGDRSKGIRFDLDSFQECRRALKSAGIKSFGGNADLILVDAHHWFTPGVLPRDPETPANVGVTGVTLDFSEAICINLSSRSQAGELQPVGEFFQALIEAASEVVNDARQTLPSEKHGLTFKISDTLGLATAKRSFLSFIYEKFGAIIGAKKLDAIAVRSPGKMMRLEELSMDGVRR